MARHGVPWERVTLKSEVQRRPFGDLETVERGARDLGGYEDRHAMIDKLSQRARFEPEAAYVETFEDWCKRHQRKYTDEAIAEYQDKLRMRRQESIAARARRGK